MRTSVMNDNTYKRRKERNGQHEEGSLNDSLLMQGIVRRESSVHRGGRGLKQQW